MFCSFSIDGLIQAAFICVKLPILGGNYNNAANAGVFSHNLNNHRTNANQNCGSRLDKSYSMSFGLPLQKEMSSSHKFKIHLGFQFIKCYRRIHAFRGALVTISVRNIFIFKFNFLLSSIII